MAHGLRPAIDALQRPWRRQVVILANQCVPAVEIAPWPLPHATQERQANPQRSTLRASRDLNLDYVQTFSEELAEAMRAVDRPRSHRLASRKCGKQVSTDCDKRASTETLQRVAGDVAFCLLGRSKACWHNDKSRHVASVAGSNACTDPQEPQNSMKTSHTYIGRTLRQRC
jgi:hypothetical protein